MNKAESRESQAVSFGVQAIVFRVHRLKADARSAMLNCWRLTPKVEPQFELRQCDRHA
jgi:hypothetical protein